MASISWATNVSGNWSDAADWSGGAVPGSGDDASVAAFSSRYYTVFIAQAAAAHSLTIDGLRATVADIASLTLGGTLTVTRGNLELYAGGAINGGTIVSRTGAVYSESLYSDGAIDQSLASGGAFNGVTFDGTLNLSPAWSALTITGGINFADYNGKGYATVNLHGSDGQSSVLNVKGATTLDDAIIDIGHDGTNGTETLLNYDPNATGAILTFGRHLTINQVGYAATLGSSGKAGDGIVNEGTINANYSGGVFAIDAPSFTNSGKINVSNGDTLSLALSSPISAALIDSIKNSGGLVSINGTVQGGTVLAGTGGYGSRSLLADGAADQTLASGGTLDGVIWRGTLDGVIWRGTLDLSWSWSAMTIAGGTRILATSGTGPGLIDLQGGDSQSSILNVEGTTTLENLTIDIGHDGINGTNTLMNDDPSGAGAMLTLGRTVTIDQTGLTAMLASSDKTGDGIINEGSIDADFASGIFSIDGTGFINEGTISVSNGDILRLTGAISASMINSVARSGGIVSINGTVTGGTILASSGGLGSVSMGANGIADTTLSSGGTLSGVTYEGLLGMKHDWSALTITNGIRFLGVAGSGPATVNLHGGNNQSSILNIAGTTLLDNVTIDIGHDGVNGTNTLLNDDPSGAGAILTLGRTVTIDQAGLTAVLASSDKAGDGMVNEGTIDANFAGGVFSLDATNFTNRGTISVSNGDTLRLYGAINATLIGSIANSGALISIDGTVTGGTLVASSDVGSVSLTGSGAVDQTLASGGTLDGVLFRGTLDLSQSWSALTITGGTRFLAATGTGPGTIDFHGQDNQSSVLDVAGTMTLDDATIDIGHDGTTGSNTLFNEDATGSGAILTLGRHLTLDQVGLTAALGGSANAGDGVVNDGTIDANLAGGTFLIDPKSFTNDGTLTVSNGDLVSLGSAGGNWSNADGQITVDGTSELDLYGSFTTADLGRFANSGTVKILGTLDNAGAVLRVGGSTALGTLTLAPGGTIAGGTIEDAGGGFACVGGTLSGVTLKGGLDLTQSDLQLTIANGITFAPGSTIDFNGAADQSSTVSVAGTTTLDGATIDIGHAGTDGVNTLLNADPTNAGAVLTLGTRLILDQVGQTASLWSTGNTGDHIVNDGTIDAGDAGGVFQLYSNGFVNNGKILVSNGDTLFLEGTIAADLIATIATSGGGLVSIGGTVNGGTIVAKTLDVGSRSLTPKGAIDETLSGGGTLNGVAFDGTLDLSAPWSALTITNGITFASANGHGLATINFHGGDDQSSLLKIVDNGNTTLNDVTINIGHDGADGTNTLEFYDPNTAYSAGGYLGPRVTINQVGYGANLGGNGTYSYIVSSAHMNLDQAGGIFTISTGAFFNRGTISIANGDELKLQSVKNTNQGTGVIAGAGIISGNMLNVGTIEAAGGTLDVLGEILNPGGYYPPPPGKLKIDAGATLKLENFVQGGQTVVFNGANANLALISPQTFGAGISGFASGDGIDLTSFGFSSSETVAFTENSSNTQGTLTVTDGTSQINLVLFGQYVSSGFQLASDGQVGTTITYTPTPAAQEPTLVAAHH
jgi:hypothetical protein